MLMLVSNLLGRFHREDRGEVSWPWLIVGIVVGVVVVIVLAVGGLIKFLIPGE